MIILNEMKWQALILPMMGLYCVGMWKLIPINIFNTYFGGNEIVDHVGWKRHCTITMIAKKNVFEFRVISTIYYSLSNDYWCNSSFIHHVTIDVIFLFFKKLFTMTEALFLVICVIVLVARMLKQTDATILRQHRPFMAIKSFEQMQQVGRVTRYGVPVLANPF